MRKLTSKKIVVLLSGGLDSTTLSYLAAKRSKPYSKNRVFTLTFDYGQRHKKELISARRISKLVGAVSHKIVKFDLTLWGGSSLTDKNKKVPKNRMVVSSLRKKVIIESIPNTYVPARNTIFLSFALAFSEAIRADEIYIGVNSIDYSGYIDCRKAFIKQFQNLIKVATVSGVQGKVIKIKTPLINLSKAQIVKLGKRLGVNWGITWSCYLGGKLACGLCDSCQLRLKGFSLAGIKDPLRYKQSPKFYKDFLESDKQR